MADGENDVRWPPESERGEGHLKRGPDAVAEAGSTLLVQDETSEEFEAREYGEEDIEIRKHVRRPEDAVPVEGNVGRDLGVDG